MHTSNLVQAYKGSPNPTTFSGLIFSKKEGTEAAKKIARKGEIELHADDEFYISKSKVNLNDTEKVLAKALKQMEIRIAYEPVCFFVPEIKSAFKPDFFTNLYLNDRMVAIEIHGLEWMTRVKEDRKKEADRYIDKVKKIKAMYPEIHFIFISNVVQSQLEATFNVKMQEICSEYYFVPNAPYKQAQFVDMFKELKSRKEAKVEKSTKIWNKDLEMIVRKELEKMRLLESIKREEDRKMTTTFKVSLRPSP